MARPESSAATGLRLHERTLVVQRAGAEMGRRFWESPELGELSPIEALGVVLVWADSLRKLALRAERHPDDETGEKKADEA